MRHIFCGQTDYPSNSSATSNRYSAIAQALSLGNEIIFVNRLPVRSSQTTGIFRVVNAFGGTIRPKGFAARNLLRLISPAAEFLAIAKINREKRIDWLHVYTQFFAIVAFYCGLSRILGFKTVLHSVEKRSEFPDRSWLFRANDWLFERIAPQICDKIIAISHSIDSDLRAISSSASSLVVPPICDFASLSNIERHHDGGGKYLLYCGSVAYEEVIKFIVESFDRSGLSNEWRLVLVLNGSPSMALRRHMDLTRASIEVLSGLDYRRLISLYKGAEALLIPLRPTMQDIARFPQKICEYLASDSVIVTTNIGEIRHYFQDGVNALVCSHYSVTCYAEKLTSLETLSPHELNCIRVNAKELGRRHFDVAAYGAELARFFKQ